MLPYLYEISEKKSVTTDNPSNVIYHTFGLVRFIKIGYSMLLWATRPLLWAIPVITVRRARHIETKQIVVLYGREEERKMMTAVMCRGTWRDMEGHGGAWRGMEGNGWASRDMDGHGWAWRDLEGPAVACRDMKGYIGTWRGIGTCRDIEGHGGAWMGMEGHEWAWRDMDGHGWAWSDWEGHGWTWRGM